MRTLRATAALLRYFSHTWVPAQQVATWKLYRELRSIFTRTLEVLTVAGTRAAFLTAHTDAHATPTLATPRTKQQQGPPVTVHNDSFQPNSEDVLDAGPVSRPSVSRGGGQQGDGMGQSPEFRPFRGKKYSLRE